MARGVILELGRDPLDQPWEPIQLPTWPELLMPVVINLCAELRLSVAINTTHDQWHPFHTHANTVTTFEYEYGVARERWAYNAHSFSEARQEKRLVLGEHAGFHDMFVPVHAAGRLRGMLVAGPFATSRPTSEQVLGRFRALTDTPAKLSDPGFSAYVTATLDILTLDGAQVKALGGLLTCFADLLVQRGDAQKLTRTIEGYRRTLVQARLTERMWETARTMVLERTPRIWDAHNQLAPIGMTDLPTHAVVGLLLPSADEPDALDALLRRHRFQRECAVLARKLGATACGKVGDHGVTFLADRKGPKGRTQASLTELATRAQKLARSHGLALHVGISQSSSFEELHARYHEALWAAEKALTSGERLVYAEQKPEPPAERLRELRAALGKAIELQSGALLPRFDRYVEAVLAHSGYQIDVTRAHLEAGFERLTEALSARGLLDAKSYRELHRSLESAGEHQTMVMDLVTAYRRRVSELEETLRDPVAARQSRGHSRALAFVRDNLNERFTLAEVARVAGFAPDYFSAMFKRERGMSFARYVLEARVERAKRMLSGTSLSVEQIQDLCGFRNRTYFHRAFKRLAGTTPADYRDHHASSHAADAAL